MPTERENTRSCEGEEEDVDDTTETKDADSEKGPEWRDLVVWIAEPDPARHRHGKNDENCNVCEREGTGSRAGFDRTVTRGVSEFTRSLSARNIVVRREEPTEAS